MEIKTELAKLLNYMCGSQCSCTSYFNGYSTYQEMEMFIVIFNGFNNEIDDLDLMFEYELIYE